MSESSAPKRVSRRTIAKGAAWTVPAIAVAAPVASAATSPPEEPVSFTGTGCKDPSGAPGSRYFFALQVQSGLSGAAITFTHTFSDSAQFFHVDQRPAQTPSFVAGTIQVTNDAAHTILLKFNNPNNAANGTLTITYTIDGVTYPPISADQYSASCGNRTPPIVPF